MTRSNKRHTRTIAKIYVDKIVELLGDFNSEKSEYYGLGIDGLEIDFYESNISAASFKLGEDTVSFLKESDMNAEVDDDGIEIKSATFTYSLMLNDKYAADCLMAKLYKLVVAEYGAKIKAAKKGFGRAIDKKYKSSK
jgi:hypothetical protein